MIIKNRKFLVLGISKSGTAAAEFLLKNAAAVYFYENGETERILKNAERLLSLGAIKITDDEVDSVLTIIDALIISPGVPINHEIAVKAKRAGVFIAGELELGFQSLSPLHIAVTGTNGKTTTVSMISEILKTAEQPFYAAGNIGTPLTEIAEKVDKNSVIVSEVSSFQLESVCAFKPDIACVLNISPDHLERHYSMENYVFLKRRILKNLCGLDYAVLNYDDETVREFADGVKAKTVFVSLREKNGGAYIDGENICLFGEKLVKISELPVFGEHNLYNAMFAAVVCRLLGVSNDKIVEGIRSFKGVNHRIQLIAEKDGKKYYDDSKATNTRSAMSAISCMTSPTILILGGSEKGEDYGELFLKIKRSEIKRVIITGASRFNMLDAAVKEGVKDITLTSDFDGAVKIGCALLDSGENLLLSPACASFDNFKNYEERGDRFKEIVEKVIK